MIISLDTETTGTDFYHGARPFFVTTCDDNGEWVYWDWTEYVDPETREIHIPDGDTQDIRDYIDKADSIVLQNAKFDAQALSTIDISLPWDKVHDTLVAAHLLASSLPHDLTALGIQYLGRDISCHEEELNKLCEEARRTARKLYPEWMIAKRDLPCMPSAKEKCWKYDLWLPKHIAWAEKYAEDHPFHTATETYANEDSKITRELWPVMEKELKDKGLWELYLMRLKLLPISYDMEARGVTINRKTMYDQKRSFMEISTKSTKTCLEIAKTYKYDLTLPKSGRNKSLDTFLFDTLKLPVLETSVDTGKPTFNADVREQYENILEDRSRAHTFIRSLNDKAQVDTAISYMDGYERYWLPHEGDYYVLHPKLNMTGTKTLQWSCSNPNEQNISEQSQTNIRKSFGPAPGRVWYSADASNIQLRIPAFEAGEMELIDIFSHPERGPYYGSYHLVIFDTLHPELFAKHGKDSKLLPEYKRTKNGNFCRQFGGQPKKVDATFRVQGASDLIGNRFPKIDRLSKKYIAYANKHGYVETIPDKLLNCTRGYPLMTSRTAYGKISPTLPFCYHVAGTAQQWMGNAMINCADVIDRWRRKDKYRVYTIIQVHDEQVFDFPQEKVPGTHKPRIEELRSAMEKCGDRINVPTPVNVERHDESWAVGVAI